MNKLSLITALVLVGLFMQACNAGKVKLIGTVKSEEKRLLQTEVEMDEDETVETFAHRACSRMLGRAFGEVAARSGYFKFYWNADTIREANINDGQVLRVRCKERFIN